MDKKQNIWNTGNELVAQSPPKGRVIQGVYLFINAFWALLSNAYPKNILEEEANSLYRKGKFYVHPACGLGVLLNFLC